MYLDIVYIYVCMLCVFSSPFLKDKLVLETEEIEQIKEQQIQVTLQQ